MIRARNLFKGSEKGPQLSNLTLLGGSTFHLQALNRMHIGAFLILGHNNHAAGTSFLYPQQFPVSLAYLS
jgi:hypothetical protein